MQKKKKCKIILNKRKVCSGQRSNRKPSFRSVNNICIVLLKSCPVFLYIYIYIFCNFIAIFFSAWPSHLARLALPISKWLCSVFHRYIFTLHAFIFIVKFFWARNKRLLYCFCFTVYIEWRVSM